MELTTIVPFGALPPENPEMKIAAADVRSMLVAKVMLMVFLEPGHVVD